VPSYVSKQEIRNFPGVGKIAASIRCLFLKRGDSKEARAQSLEAITQRQIESE